jgi:hypothetical protein
LVFERLGESLIRNLDKADLEASRTIDLPKLSGIIGRPLAVCKHSQHLWN